MIIVLELLDNSYLEQKFNIPKQISAHNCATCHQHESEEKDQGTRSLIKKAHEHNGHECIDKQCPIEAPHGHNHIHKHDHKQTPSLWPLESFIAHSKLPQALKEFLLNSSFLSPALIVSNLLAHSKIPTIFKTWLSITAMHGLNRGKEKIARLALTYLISGLASLGKGSRLLRFVATTIVAIVEKFSNSKHHDHGKQGSQAMIKKEFQTFLTNIQNRKQWVELLPNLINIESKVQIVSPLINFITDKINVFKGLKKMIFNVFAKIIATSLGFVLTDKILQKISFTFNGKDSNFTAGIGALCACCSSPVCSAAATDVALANSL